jgi:hypothetical protein
LDYLQEIPVSGPFLITYKSFTLLSAWISGVIRSNPPGFTVDENAENLGTGLVLPPWLEYMRNDLEKVLPRVQLPKKRKSY